MTAELDTLLSLQAQLETKLAAARAKHQAEFARLDRQTDTQYRKIQAASIGQKPKFDALRSNCRTCGEG
jgi:uncharacterized membrane protein YccC